MKSILVEFARLKDLGTGTLRKGDDYLCTTASLPVREIEMNIDQLPFNKLMKDMRYESESESKRQAALNKLAKKCTKLLGSAQGGDRTLSTILRDGEEELQQIDFVANAAELSAIPFEAALSADGTPLFLSGGGVVLTRRVRGAFVDSQPAWPKRPRVLFIWSSAGGEVPYKEHRKELLLALKPWMPARKSDWENVLVEVGDAKLADVESAVHLHSTRYNLRNTRFHCKGMV